MLESRQPMKPFKTIKNLFVAAAMASALTWEASAIIAYQNAAGNYGNQPGGPYVLGLQFTVGAAPLNVVQLGAFDNNQDGWTTPVTVAIYDFNLQSIVGSSVTFSGTSGASLGTLGSDGGSRFLPVTPFTLTAGGVYMVVAAGYGGSGELNYNAQGLSNPYLTQDPAIIVGNNYYAGGSSLAFPASLDGTPYPRYGAGTFEFAVPEASQFAMAGIGLLGLVYIGRAYVLRTKHA